MPVDSCLRRRRLSAPIAVGRKSSSSKYRLMSRPLRLSCKRCPKTAAGSPQAGRKTFRNGSIPCNPLVLLAKAGLRRLEERSAKGSSKIPSPAIVGTRFKLLTLLGNFGEWCNGSTTDSDSVCLGSNPSSPATCIPVYFQQLTEPRHFKYLHLVEIAS